MKYLLKNSNDLYTMINREWLEGLSQKPDRYPCVAVVTPGYDRRSVEFVYLEDFNE
jgi:hypothetical protein